MTIIIFIAFMGFVVAMETVSERHYIRRTINMAKRFVCKAKEFYGFAFGCILCWTGKA